MVAYLLKGSTIWARTKLTGSSGTTRIECFEGKSYGSLRMAIDANKDICGLIGKDGAVYERSASFMRVHEKRL